MREARILAAIALPAACAVALAQPAYAQFTTRNIGAYGGHAHLPSEAGCFTEDFGGVKNNVSSGSCNGNDSTPRWDMALPVDIGTSGASHAPSFGGSCNSLTTGPVSCSNVSMNSNGTVYNTASANATCNGAFGFQPGSVFVPYGGWLFAFCSMGDNTLWNEVTY